MRNFLERVAAGVGLLCLSPLFLVVAPLIRLSSPGPVLFAQTRVGRERRPFTCYKFRTMYVGTRQAGTHEVTQASVTRVGAFLRKTKIDEIPQLWNVVRGEMCLVGPRPCLPVQEELIAERERRGVYSVTPGITGLGQIRGIDMSDPVRLAECDAEYVARRSWQFDLKILLWTLRGQGMEDRVSR